MEAPQPNAPLHAREPLNEDIWRRQEKQLNAFAQSFGSNTESTPNRSELAGRFAKSIEDHEVVLVVPSMDMKAEKESFNLNDDLLPRVGESNSSVVSIDDAESALGQTAAVTSSSASKPDMAASVLSGVKADSPKNEGLASEKLEKPISWTKSTLSFASSSVASNISDSLTFMIDSRLRSWTLLLLKHSLSSGETESRKRLMGILWAKVAVDSVETSFKTLSLPESAVGQTGVTKAVLPLLFEATLSLNLDGNSERASLRAPGTLLGQFLPSIDDALPNLSKVEIRLDTAVLLKSMVDQARLLVLKAVAIATKTPVPTTETKVPVPLAGTSSAALTAPTVNEQNSKNVEQDIGNETASLFKRSPGLESCRSALNLSTIKPVVNDQTARLKKARSSALRLNSVLQGTKPETKLKSGVSALGERVRSVRFDGIPVSKPDGDASKASRISTATKLKSFKSFGRPHASDFDSGPRNATFGEYGGRQAVWGRDGRMVHHPTPMQKMTGDEFGVIPTPDKNAVFDATGVQRPNLPRTATALENWFLKSAR